MRFAIVIVALLAAVVVAGCGVTHNLYTVEPGAVQIYNAPPLQKVTQAIINEEGVATDGSQMVTEFIAPDGSYATDRRGGQNVYLNIGGNTESAPKTKTDLDAAPAVSIAPGGTAEATGTVTPDPVEPAPGPGE